MLQGSIVAIVTPFKKSGDVNEENLRALVNWHIKHKTDGILACGTTGESATLSHEEHRQVISIIIDEVKGRIPVIAGAGSNCTREAVELTVFAKQAGADAALVITPYYNKPTQAGLYKHFKAVASEVDIPILIYNVPGRTGCNILPETVVNIYNDFKNVIGIKEASGSVDQITQLMSMVDDKFLLFSGSDELNVPIMSVGAKGAISVLANILPNESHMLVDAYLKGEVDKAKKLQLFLYELIKGLFIETNPIPVKTALGMMGLIDPYMRLPLCSMTSSNLDKFSKILKNYKII